jgi:hypothetical protein
LCTECFDVAGWENAVSDGHNERAEEQLLRAQKFAWFRRQCRNCGLNPNNDQENTLKTETEITATTETENQPTTDQGETTMNAATETKTAKTRRPRAAKKAADKTKLQLNKTHTVDDSIARANAVDAKQQAKAAKEAVKAAKLAAKQAAKAVKGVKVEGEAKDNFKSALKKLPSCVRGGYVKADHKTSHDLGLLVVAQLALYDDKDTREQSTIKTPKQLFSCKRYLQVYTKIVR